jgi:hypothetical protein
MLAYVIAHVDLRADLGRAVNSLRAPQLRVLSIDVRPGEFVAGVGYDNLDDLRAASERMRRCPGVRSTHLSLADRSAGPS